MATIDIHNEVSGALRELKSNLAPEQLNPAIGAAEVVLFQKHFLSLPTNRQGFPSTGFWADAARATNYAVLAEDVLISVNKLGARQRYEGGEIKPTGGKKYLTIPAVAEAYGRRAGEFNNLELAFHRVAGRAEAFALVEAQATEVSFGRKRKDGSRKVTPGNSVGSRVMFWLVKSVRQAANPDVIPSSEQIIETAMVTIDSAIERALRRGGQG